MLMRESLEGVATATMRQSAGIVSGAPLEPGGVNGPACNDVAETIATLGIVSAGRLAQRVSAAANRGTAPRASRAAPILAERTAARISTPEATRTSTPNRRLE